MDLAIGSIVRIWSQIDWSSYFYGWPTVSVGMMYMSDMWGASIVWYLTHFGLLTLYSNIELGQP